MQLIELAHICIKKHVTNEEDADLNKADLDDEAKRQIRVEKRAKRRKEVYSRLDDD